MFQCALRKRATNKKQEQAPDQHDVIPRNRGIFRTVGQGSFPSAPLREGAALGMTGPYRIPKIGFADDEHQ